jgi:hypothetical protein
MALQSSCRLIRWHVLGINLQTFHIGEIEEGDLFVKFKIRNEDSNFKWLLDSFYGAVQQNRKEAFVSELLHLCAKETLPIVIGGDFNVMRDPLEKINSNFDNRCLFLFNAIIYCFNLRELDLSG